MSFILIISGKTFPMTDLIDAIFKKMIEKENQRKKEISTSFPDCLLDSEPDDLTKLRIWAHNFSSKKISILFAYISKRGWQLTTLILNRTWLNHFPTIQLPTLEKLDLTYNELTRFPDISSLPKIKSLSLCNNWLKTRSVNLLSDLPLEGEGRRPVPSLIKLNLKENFFLEVPDLPYPNLMVLNVSYNNLRHVSNLDLHFPFLEELDLERNRLKTVIDFQLTHLKILKLNWNKLRTIPDFTGLPNLKILHLTRNKLKSIPNFTGLPRLKVLKVRANLLTSVPNFTNLPRLEVLDVSFNRFTQVPDFAFLPNLEKLKSQATFLTTVPDFTSLPNLKTLDLSNNYLRVVPNFATLPRLEILKLKSNIFRTTPSFSGLQALKLLDLSDNWLVDVPNYPKLLPNLTDLILRYNCLPKVPSLEKKYGETIGEKRNLSLPLDASVDDLATDLLTLFS